MSEKKQEALARIGERYPVLASEAAAVAVTQVLYENVGENIGPLDLQRIAWPTGKATSFEVPSITGEPEPVKKLSGIVVFQKGIRTFFLSKEISHNPPDCSSMDGDKTGHGVLGHDEQAKTRNCAQCPMYTFGSQCKPKVAAFILREGQSLPTSINIPTTAVKGWRDHMIALASNAIPYWLSETAIETTTEISAVGNPFARGKFSMLRKLTPDECPAAGSYHQAFENLLKGAAPVPLEDAPPATDDSELH